MVRKKRAEKKRPKKKKLESERKKNSNSPLDSLLLVGLGVREAVDGPGLAPEEPAEVGALVWSFLFFFVGDRRIERKKRG